MADRPRRAVLDLDSKPRPDQLRAASDTETRMRLSADDYGIHQHPRVRRLDELWAAADTELPTAHADDSDLTGDSEATRGERRFRMLRGHATSRSTCCARSNLSSESPPALLADPRLSSACSS
jgi:hypothetical protein